MKTSLPLRSAACLAGLLLLAGCASASTNSTWTIASLAPTPSGGPSASAAPSGMPMPSGSATATPAGSPAASSPGATGVPASPGGSGATSPAAGQTIKLDLTPTLSITDENGTQVTNLTVKEGETVHFVIDNTAGFAHDFFIGPADKLAQAQVTGLPGIPEWSSGVQEFDYQVTADTANLEFACTLPGHYPLMHGTFTVEQ